MILHIVNAPTDLDWRECIHKPTKQRYAVLRLGGTVETQQGTMSFRAGDLLMEGVNGQLYALTPDSFEAAYDKQPDPGTS